MSYNAFILGKAANAFMDGMCAICHTGTVSFSHAIIVLDNGVIAEADSARVNTLDANICFATNPVEDNTFHL